MRAILSFDRLARAALVLVAIGCSRPSGSTTTTSGSNEPTSIRPPPDPTCDLVENGFGPEGTTRVRADVVVEDLEVPWSIAFLPGGDILVTERAGAIRLVRGGALVADPIATVPVARDGESGLLGLALHPGFAENRLFFVYYTATKGDRNVNRITRWILEDAKPLPRAREEAIIFDDIPAYRRHDGGRVRFGPDGMLYAGTGDAAHPALSQDRASPAGKLLRIGTDGKIPGDNPFAGSPAWLLGIRNVQAFDWLEDGRIILADHGPSGEMGRTGHDEIDVARAGQNLGWPDTWSCQKKPGIVTPLLVFADATPPGGGVYYRGDAIPAWKGSFIVGTLASQHLHRFVLDTERRRVTQHEVYFHGERPRGFGRLRDVVAGPDGAIYVTTSNCDGRGECPPHKDALLRITAETAGR